MRTLAGISIDSAESQHAQTLAFLQETPLDGPIRLRWYSIQPPALVLGLGQPFDDAMLAAYQAAGVSVQRRASGGTAVLANEHLLMLDCAVPLQHPRYHPDVTTSYRWFGEAWVAALVELGIPARIIGIEEARADTETLDPRLKRICFAGKSPYEVAVEDRKLVGFAQVRRRNAILLQAGVYFHWESTTICHLLFSAKEEAQAVESLLTKRVAGLDTYSSLAKETLLQTMRVLLEQRI